MGFRCKWEREGRRVIFWCWLTLIQISLLLSGSGRRGKPGQRRSDRFPHSLFHHFPPFPFAHSHSFLSFLLSSLHHSHTCGFADGCSSKAGAFQRSGQMTILPLPLFVYISFVITSFCERFSPTRSYDHPLPKYAKKYDDAYKDKIHPHIIRFSQLGEISSFPLNRINIRRK